MPHRVLIIGGAPRSVEPRPRLGGRRMRDHGHRQHRPAAQASYPHSSGRRALPMPEAMTTEHHDFGRLLQDAARVDRWLILLLVVIAAAGAYAVSLATPSRYRSAETLIYLPAGGTDRRHLRHRDPRPADCGRARPGGAGARPAAASGSASRRTNCAPACRACCPTDSNLLRIEATAADRRTRRRRARSSSRRSSRASGSVCSAAQSTRASMPSRPDREV